MSSIAEGLDEAPRFTITVNPDDPATAGFTARVVVTGGQVVVTELSLQAGVDGRALPADLAGLDFATLARAAAALSAGDFNLAALPAQPSDADRRREQAPPAPIHREHGARRRAGTVPGAGVGYTGVPSDLAVMFWRLGSAAKVADHYDVTPKVARTWIKALRAGGTLPDPWARKDRR
jgi:hypothetical protein